MKIELDDAMLSGIVVQDLQRYHEIMLNNPEEDGVCAAIEIVLSHYLNRQDYITWYKGVYGPKGKEVDFGEDVGLEVIDE
jgi:hypothetical protein